MTAAGVGAAKAAGLMMASFDIVGVRKVGDSRKMLRLAPAGKPRRRKRTLREVEMTRLRRLCRILPAHPDPHRFSLGARANLASAGGRVIGLSGVVRAFSTIVPKA